jgi:hypothetical protein
MARKERNNMFDGQMEMSFGTTTRRQRKQSRAQWWFQRMRQIVDRATGWQPIPPARPVQIWFPTAQERCNGQVAIQKLEGQGRAAEERQICE